MTKVLPIAALAAVLAVGGGWMLLQGTSGPSDTQTRLLGAATAQEAAEVDTSTIAEMVQGDPDATIEVIEYASFTCPHCASFHANQYEELKANYIDTGLIRFVYREVYFDRPGLWASMLARCGGELRFFGIADMLYENQAEWLAVRDDPAVIVDQLRRIGITAGMEAEQIDACLQDADTARTLVTWYEENAAEDGVRSTPSFVINGELYSNMSYADFAAVLDAELAE